MNQSNSVTMHLKVLAVSTAITVLPFGHALAASSIPPGAQHVDIVVPSDGFVPSVVRSFPQVGSSLTLRDEITILDVVSSVTDENGFFSPADLMAAVGIGEEDPWMANANRILKDQLNADGQISAEVFLGAVPAITSVTNLEEDFPKRHVLPVEAFKLSEPSGLNFEQTAALQSALRGAVGGTGLLSKDVAKSTIETFMLNNAQFENFGVVVGEISQPSGIPVKVEALDQFTLDNRTTIRSQDSESPALQAKVEGGGTVINAGRLYGAAQLETGGNAVVLNSGEAEQGIKIVSQGEASVTNIGIVQSGFHDIHGNVPPAVSVEAQGDVSIRNAGVVDTGDNWNATAINGMSFSGFSASNDGTIIGVGMGINAGGFDDATVTNSGKITAGNVGIAIHGGADVKVENEGQINANVGIRAVSTGGTTSFGDDASRRSEAIRLEGGVVTVENSGRIAMGNARFGGNSNFRIEQGGYYLSPPQMAGIFAASVNGGLLVDGGEVDEFGNYSEFTTNFVALDDSAADNSVIVSNTGNIQADKSDWNFDQSIGIYAFANDRASINNEGHIGVGGSGISVQGPGSVLIENSGSIESIGHQGGAAIEASSGLYHQPQSGNDVTIDNSGLVETEESFRTAIRAWSNGGAVTVDHSGTIETVGMESRGIDVSSGSTSSCTMDRSLKPAKCLSAVPQIAGAVSVDVSGDIETGGDNAHAINAWSNGGDVTVNATEGDIFTEGERSRGISVFSGNSNLDSGRMPTLGGSVVVDNGATIKTTGGEAHGVSASSNGGTVRADNSGSVTTGGAGAFALRIGSGSNRSHVGQQAQIGGAVSGTNTGTLKTTGDKAVAAEYWSNGGAVEFGNSGNVSTQGHQAAAVGLFSGTNRTEGNRVVQPGNDISINNSGTISTRGNNSKAIDAYTYGGAITALLTADSQLTTVLDNSTALALATGNTSLVDGRVPLAGGALNVSLDGTIKTAGANSRGADLWTAGGTIDVLNKADIITSGNSADAIMTSSGSSRLLKDDSRVVSLGSAVVIVNEGAITTSGDGARGVIGWSTAGTVRVVNKGRVTTSGAKSNALSASSGRDDRYGYEATKGAAVVLVNDGVVTTTGSEASALQASSAGSTVRVSNTGAVKSSGHGISVNGATSAFVSNRSTIAANGAKAAGINISDQVLAATITNHGSISSAQGAAIYGGSGSETIVNSGTISGGVALGSGVDRLSNTGVLSGKFFFGENDDALTIGSGSNIDAATFDGGNGVDSLSLAGGGKLTGKQFVNFERASLISGNWDVTGDLNFAQAFSLNGNSAARLNGKMLTSSLINIGKDAKLIGGGRLSGGLVNEGSLILSSMDSLRIDGDFRSVSGSSITLALGDAAGTKNSRIEVRNGAMSIADSGVLNIIVDSGVKLDDETEYEVATADNGVDDASSNEAEATLDSASAGFSFTRIIRENKLFVKVSSSVAALLGTKEAEAVQGVLTGEGGGELAAKLNGLDKSEVEKAVRELTTPNRADNQSAQANNGAKVSTNVVTNRMSSRFGSGGAGTGGGAGTSGTDAVGFAPERKRTRVSEVVMAYGGEGISGSQALDVDGRSEGWAQVFWGKSTINSTDGNLYGTAIGIDHKPEDDLLLGASLSYSKSNSEAANSTVNADTFGAMVYGAKRFDNRVLVSGTLGYFFTQSDTKRTALGTAYQGDFDSSTFIANVAVARSYDLADWSMTPSAGVRYARSTFDDYQETGGVGALSFSRDDLVSTELNAGLSFATTMTGNNGLSFSPELHVGVLYEAGDDTSVTSYRFSPTGPQLSSASSIARTKLNLGGGVQAQLAEGVSADVAYEGTFADDYRDHLLKGSLRFQF